MCFTIRIRKMIKKYKIHPETINNDNNDNNDNLFKPPVFINQNS